MSANQERMTHGSWVLAEMIWEEIVKASYVLYISGDVTNMRPFLFPQL